MLFRSTLIMIYYLFTIFRLFHVSIDGGILNFHVPVDAIAFIFITALLVHLKYPHNKAAAFVPPATVLAAPVIYRGIQAMQTAFLGIKGNGVGSFGQIYFLEMLLVLSAATFLTANQPTGIRTNLRALLANKFALLALFLTVSILFLYVKQISAVSIPTAFDPIGSYAAATPKLPFVLIATQTNENPCNSDPAFQFDVKGRILSIYNAAPSLKCQKNIRYYAYSMGYQRRPAANAVLDCNTVAPNSYEINNSICYTKLKNNYDFFAFAAAQSFPGQHLFFAYQQSFAAPAKAK